MTLCSHKNTHYIDWPDGGSVEICEDCGESRHHSEWANSGWTFISDIEKARKELEEGIAKAFGVPERLLKPKR